MSDSELRDEWQRAVEGAMDGFWKELTPQRLREFISAGVSVNVQIGELKETPLHLATRYNGNAEIIKELINAGAEIHAKDNKGLTPLHYAAALYNKIGVIKELINARADVNAQNNDDDTPLHKAAFLNENVEVIKELCNANADIDARGNNGEKPYDRLLHNIRLSNDPEAIALLKPKL